MKVSLILKLVARDWKSGELRLLLTSVAMAVATVTAITMFVSRLQVGMELESASFLAADRVITGPVEIPEIFREKAKENGLEIGEVLLFPSVVLGHGDESRGQLASVKAVSENYPLRGRIRVADEPFGNSRATSNIPPIGSVWPESRLFPALDVKQDDAVTIGYAELKVDSVLAVDPSRSGSMFDMAPRIIMRIEDIPKSEVVQPGSRIEYRLLLAGDRENLDSYFQDIRTHLSDDFRWRDVRSTAAQIRRALDRAERFFLIGGSLAVLLAGVAIALSAHRYAVRHFDHVGILKTLGATPANIVYGYVGMLLALGIIGVVIGLIAGTIAHFGIVLSLQSFLPIDLPPPSMRPIQLGSVTGMICLFAFALPPILTLRKISPLRVIRRDIPVETVSLLITYGCAIAGSLGLLIWYSRNVFLTFTLLIGITVVSVLFGLAAFLLLRSGRVLGLHAGSAFALAFAGLQRKYKQNIAQILIFGLAIMLLLILFLVRTSLIQEWQAQLPEDAPNHFLMNVTPEQVEDVEAILKAHVEYGGDLTPMINGRVKSVNDENVREYQRRMRNFDIDGPRLSSRRVLTWMESPPEHNRIVSGKWWYDDAESSLISVEQDYANSWRLKVGDQLTFDVSGVDLPVTIASTHAVEWESLNPNFFFVFSPGALNEFPSTYMTSFHLEQGKKRILAELIYKYPTITLIDVDAVLIQLQIIIDRVTTAVEWVLYLILMSGALVLIASIQSSRDQRMREHAVIRTLGGSRSLVLGSLMFEFAMLGLIAGVVAVAGAELTVYLIETQIFELEHTIRFQYWPIGPIAGAVLIALVGYFSTRKIVNVPPVRVLREI